MTSLHNQRFNKRNIKPHTTICDREDCMQCFGPPPIFQPKSRLFSPKNAMLVHMGVQSPDVYGGQAVPADPTPEAVALAQTVRENVDEEYVAPICNDSYEPFNGGGSDEYTCEHVGFDASGFTGPAGTLKPNVDPEVKALEYALRRPVEVEPSVYVLLRYTESGDEALCCVAANEAKALATLRNLYADDGVLADPLYTAESGGNVYEVMYDGEYTSFEVRLVPVLE